MRKGWEKGKCTRKACCLIPRALRLAPSSACPVRTCRSVHKGRPYRSAVESVHAGIGEAARLAPPSFP